MKDKDKTKEQLIDELKELRQQINKYKKSKSEHKRMEKVLKGTEECYRTLIDGVFNTSKIGIFILDSNFRIVWVNKALELYFGIRRAEVIGKDKRQFIRKRIKNIFEDPESFTKKVFATYDNNTYVENFECHVLSDGEREERWLEHWSQPIRSGPFAGGRIEYYTDVTTHSQVEEVLRKTKDHLDNIIESSLDSIVVTDKKGYTTRVNKAFLQLLGFGEEEVIGKHMSELSPTKEGDYECTTGALIQINEEFFNLMKTSISRFVEKGRMQNAIGYHIRKDNKLVPIEDNVVFLYNKEGERIGAVGIIRDITERKKMEKEIKKARDFLESIFRTSADGIMVTDAQSYITMVNEAVEKIIGYSQDELIGKHTKELNPQGKKYEERMKDFVSRLFKEGVVREFEYTWVRKDGSLVDIEINIALLKDYKGNITGSVGSIRDITKRKQAEEKFRDSEERARALLNAPVDIALLIDNKYTILDCNESFIKRFNKSKDELMGSCALDLFTMEVAKSRKERLDKLIQTGKAIYFEDQHRGRWFDSFIHPIFDRQGNVTKVAVFARDTTERKQIEERLVEYQNRLRAFTSQMTLTEEKERKRFAEYLHDKIGQQLFILKLKLEGLTKRASSNDTYEDLDNGLKITDQLIKDARSLTFELSPPILYQLGFEPALEWLIEQIGEQYGIIITFEDDKQEKPLDDDIKILLFQAVRELLTNIAKHAQAQKAKVSIRRDNSHIRVCVEDDGVGFTPSSNYFSKDENTGFGLFSIEERLDHLGGDFEIESILGRGTQITLVAPLESKNRRSNIS